MIYSQIAQKILNEALLTEKVFGQLATIYHRTDTIETVKKIKSGGVKTGYGDMGKGIYGTYELYSQMNVLMNETYGDYIIKAKVNLNKVLFLDYKEAKKVYGKNYTLVDQIKKFNKKIKIPNEIEKISDELESNPKYTSDHALRLFYNEKFSKLIKGISFTGSRDGHVLVIYDTDIVTPISYNSTFGNVKKLDEEEWTNITNKTLISKSLQKTLGNYYELKPNINVRLTFKRGITKEEVLKVARWIFNLQDKEYELEEVSVNNGLITASGTWEKGTWENGTFEGTWKDGVFKDGLWKHGVWYSGVFKDGLWEDGLWYAGTWEGGDWNNGIWLGGYDKDGKYHEKGDSPDKW